MSKWLAGLAGVVGLMAASVVPAIQTVLPDTAVGVGHVAVSAPDDESADEGHDEGQGPPPWANNDRDKTETKAKGKAKGKNDAWKQLSPAARADLMTELVREHERGMKKFAACREAGGDDCEKPLPPGLAKKL